tara:strand:- start:10994 stop:11722 length:729 start_codon:yes stop_codon:yes gene_type:complete
MKIEEIEKLINNKKVLEEEFKNHNIIKEKLESKQIYYYTSFCLIGIFEFTFPLLLIGILAFHIDINSLLATVFMIVAIVTYFWRIITKERTYIGSLFKFFTKQKLKKKKIEEDTKLFDFLSQYYLTNKEIEKVQKYYMNLKNNKDLFFEYYSINRYIKNKIFDYISFNSVEYIKENKNKLSELIAQLDLEDYEIEDIKEDLKYKLKQERERTKEDILKIFEEDEKLEEVQRKEMKNKVLLEI